VTTGIRQRGAEIPHEGQFTLPGEPRPPVIFSARWLPPTTARSAYIEPVYSGTSIRDSPERKRQGRWTGVYYLAQARTS
jgi:hypothetical protein